MEELNENLEELYVSEEEAGFTVDDDQKAEWCLKKIREEKEEAGKWADFYSDQIAKVAKRSSWRISFFENKLKGYFGAVPHKVTKTQENYVLPSGKLVFKHQAPEMERDNEQLLPWVKMNRPELVKVSESVDWAGLKKGLTITESGTAVTEDGEIVPGITVSERPDVFKVEVK